MAGIALTISLKPDLPSPDAALTTDLAPQRRRFFWQYFPSAFCDVSLLVIRMTGD